MKNKAIIVPIQSCVPGAGEPKALALGHRLLHGLVLMLAQNVVARLCGLLSQLVLAKLLRPEDFGVISLTYTVTTIAATLMNVGLDDVLLQRQRGLRLWAGPAFWISLGLALLAAGLVVLVSPAAAALYHAPRLVGLLAILALSMPIGALSSVPGMILRARMRFGFLAVYGSLEIVAQSLLTVGFAWCGYGAYSFVLPAPILGVVHAVVWWRVAAPGSSLRPQRGRWKYVVGNTVVTLASRTIIAVMGQGDYMVLGLIVSQDVVGAYYFGFRLAVQPLWMLAGNFTGVLFPALVQLGSDPRRQGEAALKAATLLSYCVMPLGLMQAAVAGPLVTLAFGPKWASSIPIIELLSIGLALDAVSWVAGSLLTARGEFRAALRYLLLQFPVFFALATAGAVLGQGVGVAWGVALFYALTQPAFVCRVFLRVGVRARHVLLLYVQPTAYAAAAIGVGLEVSTLPVLASAPLARVAVIGMIGTTLYAVLVRWQTPEVWNELAGRLRGALRRGKAV